MAGSRVRARGLLHAGVVALGVMVLAVGAPAVAHAAKPEPSVPQESPNPGAMPSGLTAEDAYQAQVMARTTGNPVEDVSQRTNDVQVFANPDGTWMVSQWGATKWVQTGGDGDSAADWASVDVTLEAGADGWVRPRAYDGAIALATGGGKTDVILETTIRDTGVTFRLLWDGSKLPAVKLDGARATYVDVWPGVDYVVDIAPSGFEQYFVLKTRAVGIARGSDLALGVEVVGGTLSSDGAGGLVVSDAAGDMVATIPVAAAWDAAEDDTQVSPVLQPWSPEPHLPKARNLKWLPLADPLRESLEGLSQGTQTAKSRPVGMSVSAHSRGVHVDLAVDPAWLADPLTAYPVVVDPTYGIWHANSSYDTFVRNTIPNANYGTDAELKIGSPDYGKTKYRSYLAFDTSGLKGKDVISGYLVMYNSWSATCTDYEWDARWTSPPDGATTWANQPAVIDWTIFPSLQTVGRFQGTGTTCAKDWVVLDLTTMAQAWVTRPENSQGIWLWSASESAIQYWKRFLSNNTATGLYPHLNVYYNAPPIAPTFVTVTGQGVSAVVSDPDGGAVGALFTVKQGGITIVDSLPGTVVASGLPSTATLPYTLAPGVEYTIEVKATDARLIGPASTPHSWTTGPGAAQREIPATDDDETGAAS